MGLQVLNCNISLKEHLFQEDRRGSLKLDNEIGFSPLSLNMSQGNYTTLNVAQMMFG